MRLVNFPLNPSQARCFKVKKFVKYFFIKHCFHSPGLSKQTEMLLKQCKKVEVRLKKLNQKNIQMYMRREPINNMKISENKCIVATLPSSNSFRILQPVATDVRENKEVANLRHTLLDSDVAYFFGSHNRSIADEMRITKVHDWLNLVENCSPSKNSSTRKRLNSNVSLVPVNRRAKQMVSILFIGIVLSSYCKNKEYSPSHYTYSMYVCGKVRTWQMLK